VAILAAQSVVKGFRNRQEEREAVGGFVITPREWLAEEAGFLSPCPWRARAQGLAQDAVTGTAREKTCVQTGGWDKINRIFQEKTPSTRLFREAP